MTLAEALTMAVRHHQAGHLDLAAALYQQVLRVAPRQPDALHLLGVVFKQRGQYDQAINLITRALEVNPAAADFHCNLGSIYFAIRKLPDALASYRRALALAPDHAEASKNLAEALRHLSELDEALVHARRAVELSPRADPYYVLGTVLYQRKELHQAARALRRSLDLEPDAPAVHNALGSALMLHCDLAGAERHLRRALELDPYLAAAWTNLGMVLADQERLGEAIAAHHKAVRLQPGNSMALCAAGVALHLAGRLDDAADILQQAFERDQTRVEALHQLSRVRLDQGRAGEAIAVCQTALRLRPGFVEAHDTLLVGSTFLPNGGERHLAEALRRWDRQHAAHLGALTLAHDNERAPSRRLRVGYVSPNFREHWQASFLLPLLREHDRDRFEIFCYSDCAVPDAVTRRLRSHAHVWRETRALGDDELARQVRADQIDILVDLTMHLPGNRALVFARKPAPIQACWLAYPGSTGMAAMDYRISDPWLDPLESDRDRPLDAAPARPTGQDASYVEQTVRLAGAFACHEPPEQESSEAAVLVDRPEGHARPITFGCMNDFRHVNREMLELWSRILQSVPDSRLVLCSAEGSHRGDVSDFLRARGTASERVGFIAPRPRREQLGIFRAIDISLDTLPFNGLATTLDSLWMGVPVVTLSGGTAAGRVGLSLLTTLRMPQWIADSGDAYVRIAVELARDRAGLTALSATLRDRLRQSPLMDAPRFARHFESALREMWQRWCDAPRRQAPAIKPLARAAIPRRIHQLWKTPDLPPRYAAMARTWQRLNPQWEHTLWTDDAVRKLISERQPELLPVHDGYASNICRADLGRYLILHEFGGVYADLDCECLKPIDELLPESGFAIAFEPAAHARGPLAVSRGIERIPCPSFLASEPGHPIWAFVFDALRQSARLPDPLDATGPFLLARLLRDPRVAPLVRELPGDRLYPFTREECWSGKNLDLELWEDRTREAFVLHYWDGTWFSHSSPPADLPDNVPSTLHNRQIPAFEMTAPRKRPTEESAPPAGAENPPRAADDASRPPRISCLMVTAGRPECIGRAIASFSAQTWPNRELLIVTSRDDPMLAEAAARASGAVRVLVYPKQDATLGEMRNFAVDRAAGELVCVWDDDDLHDRDRLKIQAAALLQNGAAACVLERLLLWWPRQRRAAISTRRAWEGSLLAVRSAMPRYAELARGEDTPVTHQLLLRHRVVSVDLPRLYVYIIHGANTTRRPQLEQWWETATARFMEARCDAVLAELSKRMPVAASNPIVVNPDVPPAPMAETSPMVSCLMVTRGRAALAIEAVDCFLAQTWRRRELLIVTERLEPELARHIERAPETLIRVLEVGQAGLTLGDLRNRAVTEARGELVCQWDDDDLCDPDRLAVQAAALLEARAGACLLRRWTIWWPRLQRIAVSTPRHWEGSLLARKCLMPPYPALARGEDTPVVQRLLSETRVVAVDEPHLYFYRVHGGNTFSAAHFDQHWAQSSIQYTGPDYEKRLAAIRQRIGASHGTAASR